MKKLIILALFSIFWNCLWAQEYINLQLNASLTGTYDYKAKESVVFKPGFNYLPTSSTSLKASIDPMIVLNPSPEDIYGGTNNGIVGAIDGSAGVSPSGAANYEIPIKVVPGTGGMVPQLSIVYNSQSPDGLLGTGFSISGLSVISRCGTNLDNDSYIDPVDFDSNDKFMLDGNKLISIGTTGTNIIYRTESNTFSKIISYCTGSVPDRFEVYTKSGLIYDYGSTTDSKFKGTGSSVLYWLVNKIRDTKGNYYTVTYEQDATNGEYRPLRIDYTGNATSTPVLTPYASVRFEYTYRNSTQNVYVSGTKSKVSKLLSKIKIYYGETLTKEYQLAYGSESFGKYLLNSVTEVGKNGEKYNPTTFQWYVTNTFTHAEQIYDQTYYANLYVNKADIVTGDFNGDGQTDFISTPQSGASFTGWRLFLADASGKKCNYTNTGVLETGFKKLYTGDFNGDGKTDIIQCRVNGSYTNYYVQFSTGTGFTPIATAFFTDTRSHEIRIGEFNGDGISDVFVSFTGITECKIIRSDFNSGNVMPLNYTATRYLPTGKKWDRVEMVDFNGDGLSDIMNLDDTGYQLMESDGYGTMSVTRNTNFPDKKHSINFGDFNGDGKTDMFITAWNNIEWSDWQVRLSTGTDFEVNYFTKKFESLSKQVFVGDINGDGRDDFFGIDKDRAATSLVKIPLYISNNDGTYFYYQQGDDAYSLKQWKFFTGDFNGDGRLDYFYTSAENTWNGYQLYTATADRDNLLKSITDGMGNATSFTYKSGTDNTVYTKQSDAVYPISDMEGAFQLVGTMTQPNGKGGSLVTSYKYEGAKIHKRGKGFLGFTKFTTIDNQTGISNTSIYEIEPTKYYVGLKRSETRLTKGKYTNQLLSEVDYTNTLKSYESGVYTFMQTGSVEKNYELPETPGTNNPYKQTTSTYTYDSYGNVLTTEQKLRDPSLTIDESTVTTTNVYTNDLTNWFLGRLTQVTAVKKSDGQPDVTRVSQFEYNPTSGLLTKEIVEPNNSLLGYSKTYEHDAYGNILKSTTTASTDGTNTKSVYMRTVYDSQGRFGIETYNTKEQKSSKVLDPYFGSTLSQTDPNTLTSTAEYDGLGRATKSTDADGTRSIVAYRWCSGDEGGPANAVYYIHSESSDAPPVIEFFDRLGRTVRKVATGFDGTKIYIDAEYDDYGRTLRTSEPYFAGSTEALLWTTITYDELSRAAKKTLPDNSEITIQYKGLTTITQNPLLQKDTRTVNQRGLMVSSTDNNGKSMNLKYDSSGNLIESTDSKGNTVKMKYDILGKRTELNDLSLGIITSVYNAFGELVSETDGKSQTVNMEYDDLGRLVKRTEKEGVSTWAYDTKPKGIGKLSGAVGPNTSQDYEYDDLGRVKKQTETIDNVPYYTLTSYDVYGRVDQVTYPADPLNPNPLKIKNNYNKYGYLEKVTNTKDAKIYWAAEKMNARGQLEQFSYGNGLRTNKTYNNTTGLLATIKTPGTSGSAVQDWLYNFNAIGNLIERKDVRRNKKEGFDYDNLNRLIKTKINDVDNVSVNYDELGNITYKSDVGNYTYNDAGVKSPFTLQSVTTTSGSILKTSTQNVSYTSFDKILGIGQGVDSMIFTYGIAYERKRVDVYKNKVLKSQKYYVGSLYEKEKDLVSGTFKETNYIFAAGGAIAIYTYNSSGTTATSYLHKDHLGSVQCITNESGALQQELSYDAWGNRRDPETWAVYTTLPAGILLARGFTGHEHMDLFDLINMDGRLYDPVIGRFLSPDLVVQSPDNMQSYNRFSYCLNNPLSLTDPSGYTWLSNNWRSLVAAAVGITVSVVTMGTASGLGIAMIAGAAGGFAGGVTGALLAGANIGQAFKAGIIGGVIGAASGFLNFASNVNGNTFKIIMERAAKHAFSNAWLNGITGGNMAHGFFTGALSSVGNGFINEKMDGLGYKVAASAVLGGTIEEIGGGKFANGAITGAYGMLFNEIMHGNKVKKYVDAMFPGRIPSNVSTDWQLYDGEDGITDPKEFYTAKKITVFIPKKLWFSPDKTLLIDCIDHELVHVNDYASGRHLGYYLAFRSPGLVESIMEYKAYSENLYYRTHINTNVPQQYIDYYQNRVNYYKSKLPNNWFNIK